MLGKIIHWQDYYISKKAKVGEWGKYDMLDIGKFKKAKKQVSTINTITIFGTAAIANLVMQKFMTK